MERVDIKIGFHCNNACLFCVQGRKRDSLPTKSRQEVERSLREAYGKGKREVVFTGGEPTLHPDFLSLVRMARDIGYEEIQVQTNGRTFYYFDFCVKAVQAGATQFSPALHGPNELLHDPLTRAPGSFEQTVQGIKNLKKLNQYVLTNTVVTSSNYQYLPELAELLVKLGVDQFQFAFIHILGTAAQNSDWIVPRKSYCMPCIKKGLDIGKQAGRKVTTEAIPFCFMQGYEDCIAENTIMPESMVYDRDYVVESYTDYRKNSGKGKVKAEKCRQCKYYRVCEGPWHEYPEIYGWGEFEPIKGS